LRARNENLEERLREVERSVTWRLLGPYRRLRSVGDDDTAGSR
jgi:hypothetical protein